jgi:hypothetical protein
MALVACLDAASDLMSAADQRDALADERDAAAEKRESDLDLAELLMTDDDHVYGADWPERRNTALDRAGAKSDRAASRRDRLALLAMLRAADH